MWVPEAAELPDESRCSHAEPLLETDLQQPSCSGAERGGEKEKSGEAGQIKRCELMSSSYVIIERSHNHKVFCQRKAQQHIFLQNRDMPSPAVDPAASAVAAAAAGWVTA